MRSGWGYRVASVLGVLSLTLVAVGVANLPFVAAAYRLLPVVGHLSIGARATMTFAIQAAITTTVVGCALFPLYKSRPRRLLDTAMLAVRRLAVGLFALAAIGYFDQTYALPRGTMIVAGTLLLVAVPLFFVAIRQRPGLADRILLVGDDLPGMEAVVGEVEAPIVGYVAPPVGPGAVDRTPGGATDGGTVDAVPERSDSPSGTLEDLSFLGGLSRLDDVLVDHDVDTAVLAFRHPDRGEFFGALDTCFEYGVTVQVPRDHAETVLVDGVSGDDLVTIDLEPWDWLDFAVKRAFDVAFAATGLLALSPVCLAIAAAIKLDSPGPVLYSQQRTARFGETFTVYKFRSMVTGAEAETGATLAEGDVDDPRVTRVGRVLRATHLDEVPQLWSILVGDMSVVGPRPERPELDADIEHGVVDWRRRWFVKPGLTGLAQIRGVTGHEPERKLRYDLEYIREQSFWYDLRIVIRQCWKLTTDVPALVAGWLRSP